MHEEFYHQNRTYIICFIILTVICFIGVWLVYDAERNRPIYNDTDGSMAKLEERISGLESRLDTMSKRVEETQKTVNGIAVGITRSTGYAVEIDEGLGRAEKRLDAAIQRSERIESIIQDVERANK